MTPVLAFDTSGPWIDMALLQGDAVLRRREEMAKGQAERLMPLLGEVLAEGGVAWGDLGALGVGTGPGNFTGIRIAVAAARGLALGLGIPAEGVRGPEALALGLGPVTVALPAPRGQVHLAFGDSLRQADPAAPLPAGWPDRIVGPGRDLLAQPGSTDIAASPLAPGIARIAARRAAPGRPRPAPVYLRAADAAPPSDPPPAILPD